MEVRGHCLRCGGVVRYRPHEVGVAGRCDLCGNGYQLLDGEQLLIESPDIDLTDRSRAPVAAASSRAGTARRL